MKPQAMQYAALTHRGNVRKRNEDSLYIPDGGSVDGLIIVADGMGGYNAGDVASALGVKVACHIFENDRRQPHVPPVEQTMRRAFNEANRAILEYAATNEFYQGMGTTMTMAALDIDRWVVGNVGDSRTYVARGGVVEQVTRDHSLVQMMVDRGSMSREAARQHPYRNVVTRAIGSESYTGADIYTVAITPGDVLLLCSDGLSNYVDEGDMAAALGASPTLGQASDLLVRLALERGGSDNVTVVLARAVGGDPNGR